MVVPVAEADASVEEAVEEPVAEPDAVVFAVVVLPMAAAWKAAKVFVAEGLTAKTIPFAQ